MGYNRSLERQILFKGGFGPRTASEDSMSVKFGLAKTASAILTWGLRHVARRPAANTPGLVALKIDPGVIGELRGKMAKGSIVVVGTNGKTTVTNLLANVVEKQGFQRALQSNRCQSQFWYRIALLQNKVADWGVLECDELWISQSCSAAETHVFSSAQPFPRSIGSLWRDRSYPRCDRFGFDRVPRDDTYI